MSEREYMRRSNSNRENVGIQRYSSHQLQALEERSTLTNPAMLFQRSSSTSSIATQRSSEYKSQDHKEPSKIIIPTTSRRSSSNGFEQHQTPTLVYNTSYGGKMQFAINKDENSIGRKEDNDIVLGDERVSKYHASIIKTAKG